MEVSKESETKDGLIKKDSGQKSIANNVVTKAPNGMVSSANDEEDDMLFSQVTPEQPIVQANCFYRFAQLACFWNTPDEPCFPSEVYKLTTDPKVK